MSALLLDAIRHRYACREFAADRSLATDETDALLEAGRLAPSAFGLEPWRFVSVTDDAGRTRIAHACFDQPAATTAAAFIAIVARVAVLDPDSDYVRARFEAEARGGDIASIYQAYRGMYDADTIAAWAQGQCNFAAAHILLQTAHLELGSCPIGGFDATTLGQALNLAAGEVPALVIALGRCLAPQPTRIRKPLTQ